MTAEYLPTFERDTKTPIMDSEKEGEMLIRTPPKKRRTFVPGFLALALCCFLFTTHFTPSSWRLGCHTKTPATAHLAVSTKELVPFEAHIMSKCPDARDCLRELILPTMMRVYEKVNFTLSYIGT